MNTALRFGILTVQNIPWMKLTERWHSIEALGFDSIWVADHFVDPYQPDSLWFESWTLLAALANQTEHVRIGTLVTSLPLRNPAMLARQAITVDHISNGRLELGLGTGVSWDPVHSMIGIENWPSRERVARFREVVEVVDLCLRNRVTSYEGQFYHLQDASMNPQPIQRPRPPITIAAVGSLMLKIAAHYADSWNFVPGEWDTPPDKMLLHTLRKNEMLNDYCEEIGRDPKTIRRSLLVFGSEARTAFNSVNDFETIISNYQDVGITEFIFYYPFTDEQIPVFTTIAREVIPRLRSWIAE
jgi:alkanesulfonate monooxygenase SsuD/methylene tetrahydromethanopterin reductase-like flavin-dependent oxidoreductase (luciferase family)